MRAELNEDRMKSFYNMRGTTTTIVVASVRVYIRKKVFALELHGEFYSSGSTSSSLRGSVAAGSRDSRQ
jgi:hypothetical protein